MQPMSPDDALGKARNSIMHHHGDPANRKHLLGIFEIQFGVVRHLSRSFGFAAYLVATMKREPTGGSKDSRDHAHNKGCFREYMELFSSRRLAIAMKEEQHAGKIAQQCPSSQPIATTELSSLTQQALTARQSPSPPSYLFHLNQQTSTSCLCSLLVGNISNQKTQAPMM